MALREKLTERMQPLVPAGETVRHVFMTQTGMSPYSPIGGAIGALIRKYWIVAVTDSTFHLARASVWTPSKPKSLVASLPRTVLAPDGKLWAKLTLGDQTHYVHRRFFGDIAAQDAELGASS